jgi:polysaccharide export outer membrane protein
MDERMVIRGRLLVFGIYFAVSLVALGQVPQGVRETPVNPPQSINPIRPDYELGPNDQILVGVPQAQEINGRPFRIDSEGFIDLPLVGRVHAGGLTVRGLETLLTTRLGDYIREPQVTITVVQLRSEPVFFLGAFRVPGIYPLQGGRTLVEMLTAVGGLQPTAGRRIKITRRAEYGPIPLASAVQDSARKLSTVEISLDSLTQSMNPAEDIVLRAYDLVTAETAQPVYVSGEVTKPSAVALGEQPSMSVTHALAEAGGFTQAARRGKVRVLRPILGTSRLAEIEVDLDRIYQGKDNDFPLLPNDVLYVPRDSARALLTPVATAILTSLPYLVIILAAQHIL